MIDVCRELKILIMKKVFTLLYLCLLFQFTHAQATCKLDTTYDYRFINGSTTKTLTGRFIYFPNGNGLADASFGLYQEFKNNTWVNVEKTEGVFNGAGYYTEYLTAEWDSAAAAWNPVYKQNVAYDVNNNATEIITQEMNQAGTALVNVEREVNEFNATGKQTSYKYFEWNLATSAWREKSQQIATFNAADLLIERLDQKWDTTAAAWVNQNKTVNTYDANNLLLTAEDYQWDELTSAWKGTQSQRYAYNAQGLVIERYIDTWDLGTSTFTKWLQILTNYSATGKRLTEEQLYWNNMVAGYQKTAFSSFTYNANDVQIGERSETWSQSPATLTSASRLTITLNAADLPLLALREDSSSTTSGVWRDANKRTYTYDANNNQTSEVYQTWNSTDNALRNVVRFTKSYSATNKNLQTSNDNWDAATSAWLPNYETVSEYNADDFRVAYEYKTNWNTANSYFDYHNRTEYICAASVGIEDTEAGNISLYPNPVTKGSALILAATQTAAYTVYDFCGRAVKSGTVNPGQNAISTNEMSSGVYLLKLNATTYKVVVQ
jgi:hypothetical protein